jgi:beta-glucosidase
MKRSKNKKPADFLWGVSTSAFQIEGFIRNDITEWERLGNFHNNGHSPSYGDAANHWNTWKEDFHLLGNIGVNAYRFSIDWGRIQPSETEFNEKALQQYSEMLDQLISQGITPMLTLHHFTHPVWFHDRTPWHQPSSISSYARFVEKVMQLFGDRIRLYITLNEPVVWGLAAYGDGKFPPGEKNFDKMAVVLHNLLLAHKEAYDIIKHYQPGAQIGIANNFIIFRPLRLWHLLDRGTSFLIHRFYNFALLDSFKKTVIVKY